MNFERIDVTRNITALKEIKQFLSVNGLMFDEQVRAFVVAYDDEDNPVACAGIAPSIVKCVAISESVRGNGVALTLATEIINLAYEMGYPDLFIYTKPANEILFQNCSFHSIAQTADVVLMENSAGRLQKYCQKLTALRVLGERIGAIVMNANPFTLGHRYLIEQALAQTEHLHLFIVGEDASEFSYEERFELVAQGIADLADITLHQGSPYIISRATFPNYFLKDQALADQNYMEIDLQLFRDHIAPALGITHRFVGTEPACAVTRTYNEKMKAMLTPIQLIEIPRKETALSNGLGFISASKVRTFLKEQNWQALAQLVPATTLQFLQQNFLKHSRK